MARAHARSAHFPFRRTLWACGKKILDTSGQKQEALNRSSILALEPEPGLTLGYTECLDSCRFLSNPSLWGWKPYGTWTQLCSLLGFAWICPLWHTSGWLAQGWNGSDDVQEAFWYLVIMWRKSTFPYFLLQHWATCQDDKFPDSVWFTEQKGQGRKDENFYLRGKNMFSCSASQDLKVLGQRESLLFFHGCRSDREKRNVKCRVTWICRNHLRLKMVTASKKRIPR